MFDKLLDFLLSMIEQVLPFFVVRQYQQGVLLRFGRFREAMGPGPHWKIPFVDIVDLYGTAMTTLTLPAQSITTKDGKSVVIKAVIKYEVLDVEVFGVKVADAKDALSDMTCGIIYGIVSNLTYAEACAADLPSLVSTPAKREAKRWGVRIDQVTITDFAKMMSIRLFNEGATLL